ncbi:MAG: NAD(P)-binding protein [Gammaproteobacteria bacterium]|nr:NAD(P)-binding protein [Gammaproteobacteria bacterium]NIR84533.1 NAD(P)-binding protein [Gammaproteobacteria bacterium]NIR90436.1 NAD(P)-binding protein [Gammaproteobacteria bacterium]NIU05584.1 NAD(P)-binding protein [Gammaproteobacteria bacterium]NIV52723.1 NAD(P)-binding protein [Gammaproteobacteria bacterium]
MRIAIIGTGVSGLVAARRLHRHHEVTLFEANDWVGGHTHTVDVELACGRYAVDTGFIVFNDWTYPHFVRLLDELGVESQPSSMSFSVRCERTGLEYNGTSLNRLFAQRRNLIRPAFYRMLRDILRFNREAPELIGAGDDDLTLGEYLALRGYSREFIEYYLVPMGAAIWSATPPTMGQFPARYFVQFFHNHGMLSVNERPTWRVVKGGSREYVRELIAPFRERIRLRTPVAWIRRASTHVTVAPRNAEPQRFDHVFLACHSDQALALLADATPPEREVLSAIPYQENDVVLHTDVRMLPARPRAWAAWNYHIPPQPLQRVAVTYNMNILQGLPARDQICVTLNRSEVVDPPRIHGRFTYHHPVYDVNAVRAQRRVPAINGRRRTWFCGAWCGYGFHEDGVRSALDACDAFDQQVDDEELSLRRTG